MPEERRNGVEDLRLEMVRMNEQVGTLTTNFGTHLTQHAKTADRLWKLGIGLLVAIMIAVATQFIDMRDDLKSRASESRVERPTLTDNGHDATLQP